MIRRKRVPLIRALEVANAAIDLLYPACLRLEIAGSVRRGEPLVKDVELVAVPRTRREPLDLFGERTQEVDELHDLVAQLVGTAHVGTPPTAQGRVVFGRRYKRLDVPPGGLRLDLFSVLEPAQWGVIYLLRTGPAGFSRRLVTPRAQGGCLPIGYQVRDGALWNGGELVPTPEEEDVFAALRAPYLRPEQRTETVRLSLRTDAERGMRGGESPRWGWYDGDARSGWWEVDGQHWAPRGASWEAELPPPRDETREPEDDDGDPETTRRMGEAIDAGD